MPRCWKGQLCPGRLKRYLCYGSSGHRCRYPLTTYSLSVRTGSSARFARGPSGARFGILVLVADGYGPLIEIIWCLSANSHLGAQSLAESLLMNPPIVCMRVASARVAPMNIRCALKPRCTSAERRLLTRHFHEDALQRMNARLEADPDLMRQRRCAAEHPFGTIKRMTAGGRFLTRGITKVKAETALSVLAYNILRAINLIGPLDLRARLG